MLTEKRVTGEKERENSNVKKDEESLTWKDFTKLQLWNLFSMIPSIFSADLGQKWIGKK